MKTILKLKLIFSLFTVISLMSFTHVTHSTSLNNLYGNFQKNKEPKNVVFVQLNLKLSSNQAQRLGDFYTIYKTDNEGHGYYFKILLDVNNVPVASFVAEVDESITAHTKQHLYSITSKLLNLEVESNYKIIEDDTARCVIKCNRANGCYNQTTNTAVLLCTAECHLSCA